MAQLADLTLNDGTASQTFQAHSPQSGSYAARWYEKTAGIQSGYISVSQMVEERISSKTVKVTAKLTYPELDAEGVVSYQSFGSVTLILPYSASVSHRTKFANFFKNLCADDTFQNAVIASEVTY